MDLSRDMSQGLVLVWMEWFPLSGMGLALLQTTVFALCRLLTWRARSHVGRNGGWFWIYVTGWGAGRGGGITFGLIRSGGCWKQVRFRTEPNPPKDLRSFSFCDNR